MFDIIRYTAEYESQWNQLVALSRNGTFMFDRNYMDYHCDRFTDLSFLICRNGKLLALMPGNISETTFYSHQGLTYGGLIMSEKLTTVQTLCIFEALVGELKNYGVERWIYKPVPHIYHRIPSEEDLYALFRLGARQIGCNISSTIVNDNQLRFSELRRKGIRKAMKEGVEMSVAPSLADFWQILSKNLADKYAKQPVHSVSEMELLMQAFPANILLHTVHCHGEVVGGVVVYLCGRVAHVQYISASEKGKESGALDYLFNQLIFENYAHIDYFDFGVSTENMGAYLNESLIFQKEGFGGRGIIYPVFELEL